MYLNPRVQCHRVLSHDSNPEARRWFLSHWSLLRYPSPAPLLIPPVEPVGSADGGAFGWRNAETGCSFNKSPSIKGVRNLCLRFLTPFPKWTQCHGVSHDMIREGELRPLAAGRRGVAKMLRRCRMRRLIRMGPFTNRNPRSKSTETALRLCPFDSKWPSRKYRELIPSTIGALR